MLSAPDPPSIVSLPAPPRIVSLPAPPSRLLLADVDVLVPRMMLATDEPITCAEPPTSMFSIEVSVSRAVPLTLALPAPRLKTTLLPQAVFATSVSLPAPPL